MTENNKANESNLSIFQNDQFGEIRVINRNGNPWFVAADLCRALDIGDTHKALTRLDEDEKGKSLIPTPGGVQEMSIVSEAGMYTLVLSSRKPEAHAFNRWITHDVIPDIRKHGMYATPMMIDKILADPWSFISIFEAYAVEKEKNALLQPKADYFDAIVDRNLLTSLRDTAKELKVGERKFIRFLLDNGFLYRDQKNQLQAYAVHVENGLFEVKETVSKKNKWKGTQTLVTPKGRETLRLLISSIQDESKAG